MCLAIPGQVKEITGHKAVVQYPQEKRTVFVGDDPVKAGDWVMVQMGVIVRILKKSEAGKVRKMWK